MLRPLPICLLAISLLPVGCRMTAPGADRDRIASAYDARSDPTRGDIEDRISACRSISLLSRRDPALAIAAMDAGASGHADQCKEALDEIGVLEARDAGAAECAGLAIEHSTLADARRFAAIIRTHSPRDRVYGQIERGARWGAAEHSQHLVAGESISDCAIHRLF